MHSKFFDLVDYTVEYNASVDAIRDNSQPTLLESGVWIYQISGHEKFLRDARIVADTIEKSYIYNSYNGKI